MILIGRGLDLGKKGTGKREQGTGEAKAETESWERNLRPGKDLKNVKASSKAKSRSDGAERKRTCAVLRVRGKGRKIPNHDNPIFPVTIA